jgi:hypothetical protein
MTKIDGRRLYDQLFGHGRFGLSTSDLMWPILRGKSTTKPNGLKSKSAQSSLVLHMGRAQQCCYDAWAKPNISAFFFYFQPIPYVSFIFDFSLFVSGPNHKFLILSCQMKILK